MKNFRRFDNPILLELFDIAKTDCILVLSPHPDDFDAIGVTLKYLHDKGNPIHVAVVGSGISGVEDRFYFPPTPETKARVREKEQRASCKFFGLSETNLRFLKLKEDVEGRPLNAHENIKKIRSCFETIQPDFVFLPHGNDTNITHRRTYAFFQTIASQTKRPITACLNKDPKTIKMRYDLITPFDQKGAQWKGELLRLHQSQHQRNLNKRKCGFDARILNLNRQIAEEVLNEAEFAEAFELEYWNQAR